jgi:chorismate synthase
VRDLLSARVGVAAAVSTRAVSGVDWGAGFGSARSGRSAHRSTAQNVENVANCFLK